jgi:hypothetical protein
MVMGLLGNVWAKAPADTAAVNAKATSFFMDGLQS